jgi:Helicase conserved C-terminal domain/DEAD/DEAH box helicase
LSLSESSIDRLSGEVLTFIEQREAEQIAYGIFDITIAGAEVLDGFMFSEDTDVPDTEKAAALEQSLNRLNDRYQILRFDQEAEPRDWLFRSRASEIVRLLSRLRQRIVRTDNEKPRHRLSNSKRLVEDIKFTVVTRQAPRRTFPVADCLRIFSDSANQQHRRVTELLIAVVSSSLVKLRSISGFQKRTLEAILKAAELDEQRGIERGVVVTAGTGAGKTYSFFLPTLMKVILERCLKGVVGVKAICIYPRVALSENQLGDFVEVLFHLNLHLGSLGLPQITIGIESGAAVYKSSDFSKTTPENQDQLRKVRGWSYDAILGGYLSPFAYCVGTEGQTCAQNKQRLLVRPARAHCLVCPICNKQYPFLLFARDHMAKQPPDLLVATTESLHRRLLSSDYQYLFGTESFCAPSVVMLDEIHLQTSTAGTQVALLLRRLFARIRLGKTDRAENANLTFVGLSATIAHPVAFVSELTGLPIARIVHVQPLEQEMTSAGAERFVFVRAEDSEDTAVLSTLLQTAMCTLHNMEQPGTDNNWYKTFGFVQSLDLVGRWLYQMQDAEKNSPEQRRKRERTRQNSSPRPIDTVPLYAYRYPPHNRRMFPNYLGFPVDCDCENRPGPNLDCPLFQAGECWWALCRSPWAKNAPLEIKRKSGGDRSTSIEESDDLVITTSALEVGYDDDTLMCVIQYNAPTNVASFVQRKGRGGRGFGTRPLIVTVLSPYKSTDLFLFRNQHLLTEPTFRKLPLNSQNRFLQRIHGFYALFDWFAYQASRAGVVLELEKITRESFQYLLQKTSDYSSLFAFKDYLQRTFGLTDHQALLQVLTDNADGLLQRVFNQALMTKIAHQFEASGILEIKTRDLLRQNLPENLFSDINLPEVRVQYRPNSPTPHRDPSESISLALSETIPGNVTFRGGEGSTWIPPIFATGEAPLLEIDRYYSFDLIEERVRTTNLPMRALQLVGIDPQTQGRLTIYRPFEIRPVRFSSNLGSTYWYFRPDTGILQNHVDPLDADQGSQPIATSSSAFSISAVEIKPERGTPTPAFVFSRKHPCLRSDSLPSQLLDSVVLFSAERENLNLLDVRRIVLGSQFTLKLSNVSDEVRGIAGFTTGESGAPCALGYELITEGLRFDLDQEWMKNLRLPETLCAVLRANAVRHAFLNYMTVQERQNFFAAENLGAVLSIMVDTARFAEGQTLEQIQVWLTADHPDFLDRLRRLVTDHFQLSKRKAGAVYTLAEKDKYLKTFIEIYTEMTTGGETYQRYIRDSFQYSLTVALKQTAQEVAGVEALNYVAAWTELHIDFDARAADRIWLYEIGMGGIGVMRATQEMLRREPERFWGNLAQKMVHCPTGQEESFLRHLLSQPEKWLATCESLASNLLAARGAVQRGTAVDALLASVRSQIGLPIRQVQLKALLRVFIPEFSQPEGSAPVTNWKLYRELNYCFLPRYAAELGREPTFAEARGRIYLAIAESIRSREPSLYPQLEALMNLYQAEYAADTSMSPATQRNEIRRAFETAVDRRLLLTCRCCCPSCLEDRSGEIEAPTMSRLLLNRPLLTEWVVAARATQTLHVEPPIENSSLTNRIRGLFEAGHRSVFLRAPAGCLSDLCAVISYLSDAGIDTTDRGMLYPMITDLQVLYPTGLSDPPMPVVEVQIRPID